MSNWRDPDKNKDFNLPPRPKSGKEQEQDPNPKSVLPRKESQWLWIFSTLLISIGCLVSLTGFYFIGIKADRMMGILGKIEQSVDNNSILIATAISEETPIPTPTQIVIIPTATPNATSTLDFACQRSYPSPQIILNNTNVSDLGTRFNLAITNKGEFEQLSFSGVDNGGFCSTSQINVWIEVFGDNGMSYRFCNIKGVNTLDNLWFISESNKPPVSSIYLIVHDNKCNKNYASNTIVLPK